MAKISGIHIPSTPRNYWINGNLDFWQRVGGNTTTFNTASTSAIVAADRLRSSSGGATTKNWSVVRSTDVPSLAQSGFNSTYSSLFTMITGIASPAASDYVIPYEYSVEGLDYVRLHGKTVTFGFWVKASVPGTYNFSLRNGAFTRTYLTQFTVSAANTWEFKAITVTLETSTSGYSFDNTLGLLIDIGSIAGSTSQSATMNAWQAGSFVSGTSYTNWQATNGATLRIAQISLVEGALGLGAMGFIRAGNTLAEELEMCQRYFEKSYSIDTAPGTATSLGYMIHGFGAASAGTGYVSTRFKAEKRIVPTLQTYDSAGTAGRHDRPGLTPNKSNGGFAETSTSGSLYISSDTTNTNNFAFHWTADAEL